MELLNGHPALKGQNFLQVQIWGRHLSKYHIEQKTLSVLLVLPCFPVSIWKNLGQWALTVYPTADEGQQLMLSHIPAHLPRGNNKTLWNFSQQWDTIQYYTPMKHHAASPKNEAPHHISQQSAASPKGWSSYGSRDALLGETVSPFWCCWELDGTEQVLLASDQPQHPILVSGSQTQSKLGCAEPYIRPSSAPSPPSLGTIEWCWKDKGKQMWNI